MNERLSKILIDRKPKDRNKIFRELLDKILENAAINTCVLNEKRFFIECDSDTAEKITGLSEDIEVFISNNLLDELND